MCETVEVTKWPYAPKVDNSHDTEWTLDGQSQQCAGIPSEDVTDLKPVDSVQ